MKTVTIYYNRCEHTSRILTGFFLLAKEKKISLQAIENKGNFRGISFLCLEAEVDGKRFLFDLGDSWWLGSENGSRALNDVDGYFARSYIRDPARRSACCEPNMHKVHPLGFDYYATFPGNPMDRRPGLRQHASSVLKTISGYNKCFYVPYFEGKADQKSTNIKIIFMTRLWDPDEVNPNEPGISEDAAEYRKYMIEERRYINRERIQIIRELQKQYGNQFFGGVFQNEAAEKLCPELILNRSDVRKKAYLDRMKQSDICIGSMGLHQSIGWKTGEYVAAARAIVAEKFVYEVSGDFSEGKNYIPFTSSAECIEAVERLYHDPDAIYRMKLANEQYYRQYLRPEQQIINALWQAGIELE